MTDYNDWCSKVDRTDYSNDTTNAVAKGNLTKFMVIRFYW